MTKLPAISRDPVCGVEVGLADALLSTSFHGLDYHFCSEECRRRFIHSPALYAGPNVAVNRHLMPKKRRLKFLPVEAENLKKTCEMLHQMKGVMQVSMGEGYVLLEYDLQQVSLVQIEDLLQATGLRLKNGLHGIQRSLWRFTEQNERDNAADTRNGACCSRPPARM